MSPLIERTRRPEAATVAATSATARSVEHIGNVVAHPGQRAEVDLGEAQFGDRRAAPAAAVRCRKLIVEHPSRV